MKDTSREENGSSKVDRILVSFTLFIPFSYRSPWLLSTFTSRKGSFMKVSIILGDRRERSEQREPRMGGNRSERSRVSSGVVDSRPFLRHLRFISLSIPPTPTPRPFAGDSRRNRAKEVTAFHSFPPSLRSGVSLPFPLRPYATPFVHFGHSVNAVGERP